MQGTSAAGADGDQFIYFYNSNSRTGEYISWNDFEGIIDLSTSLRAMGHGTLEGNLSVGVTGQSGDRIRAKSFGGDVDAFRVDLDGETYTPVLHITGGADLSESFEVRSSDAAPIEPGTVVCIDPERTGELRVCESAYDAAVAGVVSGAGGVATGMLMGQAGTLADGDHPIALSGRVYVRADASQQPIAPGDLLTTSGRPGRAMRASDPARRSGATLGKAMSALDAGEGLVLVLVNLL
jgi:hypothetical protein